MGEPRVKREESARRGGRSGPAYGGGGGGGAAGTEGERAGAGTPRGWGAGPEPAVPLCSSPPPGLGGSPAARAASQLTRGAEELSGAPRPAPPVRGARTAIGQRAGLPGPPRPGDIREAIKGSGCAGSRTAAPPGCERLRPREPKSKRARERAAGARPAPPLDPAARPARFSAPPGSARPRLGHSPELWGGAGSLGTLPRAAASPDKGLAGGPGPLRPPLPTSRARRSSPPLPARRAPAGCKVSPGGGGGGGCASRERWPRS